MAVDKLVPQYLNKDEDERLVKPVEMTDALNVRVSSEEQGTQGIVKNVEGNTSIDPLTSSDAIPSSGENRVIGVVRCEAGKCMYFFLYNSGDNHGIYRYDSVSDKYEKVYEAGVLNFGRNTFVKGDVVINQEQEHLLYFTDNRNEPRKINATKALNGGYSSVFTTGTDEQREKFLTVCKQPPLIPATWSFSTNSSVRANNLKESCFQFTYQYVYDDGELSALSPYSTLAVSRTHVAYDSATSAIVSDSNNQLNITVNGSDGPVTDIRVFARRNNDGAFFKIAEIPNGGDGEMEPIEFLNDKSYLFLDDQTVNKPFDAVPRRAFAQTVSNNRLMYGNYLEGFDNVDADAYSYPVYHTTEAVEGDFNFTLNEGTDATHTAPFNNISHITLNYNTDFARGYWPPFNGTTDYTSLTFATFKDYDGQLDNDGIHFDIDISEFPSGGFDDESEPTVILNASILASDAKLGIVAGSASDSIPDVAKMSVPIQVSVTDPDNSSSVETKTMYLFNTNSDHSHLSNLALDSDILFNTTFPVTGINTKQQFASALLANDGLGVIGTSANASVYPGDIQNGHVLTHFYTDDEATGPGELRKFNALLAQGPSTGVNDMVGPPGNTNDSILAVKLRGTVTFMVYAGAQIDANTVRFYVRVTGVDLSAAGGMAFQHNVNNPVHVNDFINGTSLENNPIDTIGSYEMFAIPAGNISCNVLAQENDYGPIRDFNDGDGAYMTSILYGYDVSGTLDVFGAGESIQSFKAAANHDLGIVYFDHRGRASGVQPLDGVSVASFGHWSRGGNNGHTEIDMRVIHDPPDYAERWAPVYSKNTTYESILQITVAEAALGIETEFEDILAPDSSSRRRVITGLAGGINGQLFISARTLEGKSNSYKELKGGQIDYQYQEGDILRVLQYSDASGNIVRPSGAEFPITSYKYYNDDEDNPIKLAQLSKDGDGNVLKDENAYRRTGWFFTVRDNDVAGFSKNEINTGTDYFSQNCVVEIYRPLKATEQKLYYEIGKSYPIVEAGGVRTHGGDRSNTTSPTFNITVEGTQKFISSQRLYRGDKVITSATASGYTFIDNLLPLGNSTYLYYTHSSNPFNQNTLGTGVPNNTISTTVNNSNSTFRGVITLREGDVYLRIREQLVNPSQDYQPVSGVTLLRNPTKPDNQYYEKFLIEDSSVSDFFDSKAVSTGRPFIETPEQKEIERVAALTYSDPYVSDSNVLHLSSFNPTLFPYKDFGSQYGKICFLMDSGESVTVMQEKKVGKVPVGRTLIESAADGQLVTSSNVLGTEIYYAGDYGPGLNPESVVERFGLIYFSDMEAGKVIRLSSKGIEPISDIKMESFFEELYANLLVRESIPRIPTGIDPENGELIVTTEGQDVNDITFGTDAIGDVPVPDSNARVASASGTLRQTLPSDKNQITWDKDPLTWESTAIEADRLPQWDKVGTAIAIVDRLTERNSVFIEKVKHKGLADEEIDIVTSDYKYRGVGLFNPADGSFKLPSTLIEIGDTPATDASVAVTVAAGTDDDGKTLAFSTMKGFWLTFYSFNPEMYGHLGNRFFSFENGQIWRHNVNAKNNNFYGTQYDSMVELVSKGDPSMVKVYNALSLEGDDNWAADITNSTQETDITTAMYETKEGLRYSVIPKDNGSAASDSSGSNIVVLGRAESVSGDSSERLTFSSRVSNLPFGIGDTLKILNASSTTTTNRTIVSVVDRKTLELSDNASGLVGYTIIAISDDIINGDHIRDYYAKIKLTNTNTSDVELYAVNAVYTPSPMHNETNKQ